MESKRTTKKNTARESREDGNATKARLIETAGQLIAKQGYEKTTSKEICQLSKVNLAAINYHFGSREGLYRAVLHHVHQQLLGTEELDVLQDGHKTPAERLDYFLDVLTEMVQHEENWAIRVWIREIISPSPLAEQVVREESVPVKLNLMLNLLHEYTGLPMQSTQLHGCLACMLAPFVWYLLLNSQETANLRKIVPIRYEDKDLPQQFKAFVLGGLERFRQTY
ncbi:CerR family C-terminal domain-containing protein [Selenomonas ruminantium]|uniref:Transcriptional regulator, TetR family n=1 Tax=Selenomonas ruminantium TaxID=971 RepID=A0A1I0Y2S1_SELRU|nr:CerR family C-terminal domain-containing protein [Selenomonas ruminantium]SFB06910.1 transcriptional regulator, TetR family [Selenomonas ruminantium]